MRSWSRTVLTSVPNTFGLLLLSVSLALGVRAVTAAEPAAGDYHIARWTVAEGLPQNTINDIVLLPSGELWLATFGGLTRFDGHAFTVLDMAADAGMPANRVVSLIPQGDSLLFLTQQGHLGRVRDGRTTQILAPPETAVDTLELLVDRTGGVFAKSADGRAFHSDGRQPWQPLEPRGAGTLHDLVLDQRGDVWATWDATIERLTGRSSEGRYSLPERDVVAFSRAGGGVWLGLERGLARFEDGQTEALIVRPPLLRRPSAVTADGDGALLVASDGDVSRLERQADGTWSRTSLPLGLPSDVGVRVLLPESGGTVWVGTVGGGLIRASRLPTRRYGADVGLRDVTALADDGNGGAFVASGCQRLFHVGRSGRTSSVRFPPPTGRDVVGGCGIALATSRDSGVWVRMGPHLFVIRPGRLDAQSVTGDLPVEEGPVVANANGTLWVLSRSGNVRLLSPDGRPIRTLALPPPVVSASASGDGTLWVGGDGRVFRVGPTSVDTFGPAEHVPRGLVRDILPESDGSTWVATYGGGLGRVPADRIVRVTAEHGLPDNAVSRVLDDGRGRLWISTNRGVAVVERLELEALSAGRLARLSPVVLGAERGVDEANFGSPAGFVAPDGRLWFGTIRGAISLDAAAFPFNRTPLLVRIEHVTADDTSLPVTPEIPVPPGTVRVRIGFTAIERRYADQVRFRFQIEGLDADWVDAGRSRSIEWASPGPGRHLVRVAARNEDGVWSSAPATMLFDVAPSWWQSTWFRVATIVGLGVALVTGYRWRLWAVERRHAARLRVLEDQRSADARLASVRAQLEHVSRAALAGELAASIAHEVRQPIGAIVNNAEAGRRQLAFYAARPAELEHLFSDIVADGMRVSQVVKGLRSFLQPTESGGAAVDLSALVRDMLPIVRRELENHRVTLTLDLADDLPTVEGSSVQLGQVVVNLVVNACEALDEVAGERSVRIATRATGAHVGLSVWDSGPGLRPDIADHAFEPFLTTKPRGLGMGLAICRTIAERHGGQLTADWPEQGGFRMTLGLPFSREGPQ